MPVAKLRQVGSSVMVAVPPALLEQLQLPFVARMMTGGDFARIRGVTRSLTGLGLSTQRVVGCDQPRVLD